MLKIRFKDNKYNAVWLVEPKITIGRSATNALVVDDPQVGDVHLEVLVDNEHLTLRNLLPAQAVAVNGQDVTGACELKPGDQITMGAIELVVIDPKREASAAAAQQPVTNNTQVRMPKLTGWSLKANHAALAGRVFPLKDVTVIGRSSECDISLPAAHLSRRHAQLQVVDGVLLVKDLNSANGTFLNGKRVIEARVMRGDELRFDALSFGVIGPADDLAKTTVRKPVVAEAAPTGSARRAPPPRPQVAVIRKSSANAGASGAVNRASGVDHKGKYGLIFLGVIAIVVITTLIFTRK
jgi:pSer/pThr/pTyr-binding forkhead associated (FHA) protein